jgi:hypothetical protein
VSDASDRMVLLPVAAQAMARLVERTGMSKANVVNRALQIYDYIEAETRQGTQLLLRRPNGEVETLKIL